ncbi:hypothetical protein H8K90_02705 [Winogradskyella echinorum]|uniref:Uncharacterized protein n=1 Tax=Winogradskyella echinorum TaxID=538189 RepID=A0ABR6XXS4_9FLAO|nr:hypothetical protein [Winogradskyella echinorum]MBC3845278.1 hypothetical protein [Winogradskyella echinorum]MBC5749626.1 hypothetical protein [Winogradskyella echinorum]
MFKYSICHPEKENIEYRDNPISGNEVLRIAKEYPWVEKLELLDSLNEGDVCYSPSLDFTSLTNEKSFCLTANYDNTKKLEFSLWYNRPKKVKILFGLLGEKEKMVVDDVWSNSFDKSLKYLEHFVIGNYSLIEKLYTK